VHGGDKAGHRIAGVDTRVFAAESERYGQLVREFNISAQ